VADDLLTDLREQVAELLTRTDVPTKTLVTLLDAALDVIGEQRKTLEQVVAALEDAASLAESQQNTIEKLAARVASLEKSAGELNSRTRGLVKIGGPTW
jgi:methyl-accepting chemotaxis protein